MSWSVIISFAAALLAITDPIGNLPFFVSYTGQEKPAVQRWLALFIALTVLVGLLTMLLIGQSILVFFGISIAAFQIAGGVLLLLIGIDMVRGQHALKGDSDPTASQPTTFGQARQRFRRLLIPLGVPLFVGPGSISTVILYANRAQDWTGTLALAMVIVFVATVTFLSLWAGRHIRRIIGDAGLDISTRLLGLLLAAIAVQFMLAGLSDVTGGFINAHPPAMTQPATG